MLLSFLSITNTWGNQLNKRKCLFKGQLLILECIFLNYFIMCVSVLLACMSVHSEARRECQISWKRSYRWL